MKFLNMTLIPLLDSSYRNYLYSTSLQCPSTSQTSYLKDPGSPEEKHWILAICQAGTSVDPQEWKTNNYLKSMIPQRGGRNCHRQTYTKESFQQLSVLFMANPFNDRPHRHISTFQSKKVFVTLKDLTNEENHTVNHIFSLMCKILKSRIHNHFCIHNQSIPI